MLGFRVKDGLSFTLGQGTFYQFGKGKINQVVFEVVQMVDEPIELKTLENEEGYKEIFKVTSG